MEVLRNYRCNWWREGWVRIAYHIFHWQRWRWVVTSCFMSLLFVMYECCDTVREICQLRPWAALCAHRNPIRPLSSAFELDTRAYVEQGGYVLPSTCGECRIPSTVIHTTMTNGISIGSILTVTQFTPYNQNSTASPYGAGSPYAPNSITNEFGIYGNPYSNRNRGTPAVWLAGELPSGVEYQPNDPRFGEQTIRSVWESIFFRVAEESVGRGKSLSTRGRHQFLWARLAHRRAGVKYRE